MSDFVMKSGAQDNHEKRLIDVVKITTLLEDEDIEVTLLIVDFLHRRFVERVLLRSEITPNSIKRLVEKSGGVCLDAETDYQYINSKLNNLLISGFNYSKGAPCEVTLKHEDLGWFSRNNQLVFQAASIYTEDEVVLSSYYGQYDIEGKGTIDALRDLYLDNIFDNIPMEAVMCMAVGATLLPFANLAWHMSLYNPVNHLLGNSTTGKTTAACLFVSFGGSLDGKNSFFLSFLGTQNAILKQIGNNSGFPVAVDEFSMAKKGSSWDKFVYALSNGRGIARCKAGGSGVQEVDLFSTVFMTTGEASILSKCSMNDGLRARLFEFEEETWTRSAEESDIIKSICRQNYGILTPLIAQFLLRNSVEVKKTFDDWSVRVREKVQEDKLYFGIGDRIQDYVSLYMTGCEVLANVLGVKMHVKRLFEFFYAHIVYKNALDDNLGTRAYETLYQYYARNRRLFPDEQLANPDGWMMLADTEGFVVHSNRGHYVGDKKYNYYLVIMPEVVEHVLRKFSDMRLALKMIQKEKLLRAKDAQRLYHEMLIDGVTTKVYAFWIDFYF